MFQQKRKTINTYEGVHFLVKLRAVGRWYISNFLRFLCWYKFEHLFFRNNSQSRSSHHRCSMKKAVLKDLTIFTRKRLCQSLFLIKLQTFRPATLFKKSAPIRVFFCEYCKIFKNTYFEEYLQTLASCSGCFF